VGFYLLLGVVLIAAEAGALALVYRIARMTGNDTLVRAALYFAIFFLPLYLWTGWWDYIPLLLLLAALYSFLKGRDGMSAILVGVGMLTKLFPVLMIPAAACFLPSWRRKIGYGALALATAAVLVLPFGLANPAMTRASFMNIMTRPSWETIWALFDGYYSYGIVADFPGRFDPAQALAVNHPSRLPWTWITAAFGAAFAGICLRLLTWRDALRGRRALEWIAALGVSISWLLLYSKGYSPQFLMWVAPFVALILPNRRGAVVLGVLQAMNLIELPVYITFFPDQTWLLWLTVVARTTLFIWLAWVFWQASLALSPAASSKPQPQTAD
jgi:hypothetical protein